MDYLIEQLEKYISSQKANFGKISKRINNNPDNNPKTKNQLLNQYSEIYLDILLENIIKTNIKELKLNQDQLLDFSYEGKRFKKTKEKRFYVRDSLMTTIAEYDNLATYKNTPIIFEVKMGEYGSIEKSLTSKKLRKKVEPIKKAYNKEPLLLYIVPKDVFERSIDSEEKGIHNLKNQNGQMISFPYSKEEFSKKLFSFLNEK